MTLQTPRCGQAARPSLSPACAVGLLLCLAALIATAAHAACLNGQPALADEFAQSTVVVARVQSARNVQDDPDDPAGISATLYRLAVHERLRGTPPRGLELRSDNTSSRFPMERGPRYLLFIQTAQGGAHYVDACGHSGALPQASGALAQARELASKRP